MKKYLQNSFYQLLAIYTFLVLLVSLNLFWKYSFQMSLFALIAAIIGIFAISREKTFEKSLNKKLHYFFFILAILLIFLFRTIPYIGNSVPLGYDAGIYKYGIENGLKNLDSWILRGGMEPGFLYLMEPFKLFFSMGFILKWLLIIFCVLLGVGIYFVSKEFFSKETGLIALFVYAVSIIQFKTFWYMYYKNIIGLILALFSIYFLEKSKIKDKKYLILLFVIFGGFLGAVHRPTFYIFGLSYFFYAFISPYKNRFYNFNLLKKNIFYGVSILIIASLFYLGGFREAILIMFEPVLEGFLQPGESSGTFINFFTYQYSTLIYLPFAILGFFALIKRKDFNMLFFWTLVTGGIVYFQFFFFNRFIIHLDIALIILASLGFSIIIQNKRKFGIIVLIIMLFAGGFITLKEVRDSNPLINEEELKVIEKLRNTEENAYVMATSSYYSPWLQGYSGRRVIAPGLFDYNKHNKEEWIKFWTTENLEEVKQFMGSYKSPVYVHVGSKQKDTINKFTQCFENIYGSQGGIIYKYSC